MQRGIVVLLTRLMCCFGLIAYTPQPTSSSWFCVAYFFFTSLKATREDVKAEVMKAPKRRIDNVITRLTDSVHLLQVHTTVSSPTILLLREVAFLHPSNGVSNLRAFTYLRRRYLQGR